jgi:hypothetical protein
LLPLINQELSPFIVRMYPEIRRDLTSFGQPDHMHWANNVAFGTTGI